MFKELRFALYAIKKNIQNNVELRTSFLMNVGGMAVNNIAFIILWVYFVKSVGVINGWTALDIIALQGFTALSYGLAYFLFAGIRKLPDYVATGGLDRFILSPKNLLLRIGTSWFVPSTLGDTLFGVICLVIYGIITSVTLYQIALMVLLIILSTIIFLGVSTAIYAMSLFFTDPESVTNSLYEIFLTPAIFHGGAFQGATRFFFTFIIPSLLVGALPVEIIRDISMSKLSILVALAIVWLIIPVAMFNKAIKKYESSNFMTFGS
ncbi:MAG: hypothetical protein A3B23_01290 [Candidatus Colwellbacteria bacterium RIFCSPLOWO2_01_FULL_48_10]|uniref:ABC transporter permease n=2 Tax=Bacteria candidate phyla TaxID=1783234 RepID=A0A1F5P1T6_9BACT|nr:MAG: hypothetical protein A2846_05070 [Candidatus Doudnabacteria bacterium RIFCSPHIGHO2_01_FULL_49_9]OGY59570.1 MAG: hypothetical protein A3B23_01290 [Candidatus Colwellbacteria bacterium RIFCSPLOWO2_01_FULL_48_10]